MKRHPEVNFSLKKSKQKASKTSELDEDIKPDELEERISKGLECSDVVGSAATSKYIQKCNTEKKTKKIVIAATLSFEDEKKVNFYFNIFIPI